MNTVLLISNAGTEMTYMNNYLESQGLAIAHFSWPFDLESLQKLSCSPDIIVCDMYLPPSGTEEVFAKIDSMFARNYYLIALVDGCSRHSSDDFKTAGNLDASSIIAKPFSPLDLLRCIELIPEPAAVAL